MVLLLISTLVFACVQADGICQNELLMKFQLDPADPHFALRRTLQQSRARTCVAVHGRQSADRRVRACRGLCERLTDRPPARRRHFDFGVCWLRLFA